MCADKYDIIRMIARRPVSLFESLHFVSDDPIKAEIEDLLQDFLEPGEYDLVCAVFDWATLRERKKVQQPNGGNA